MPRFVIEGRNEKDALDGTPLYWSNVDGWVSLDAATVFLDTHYDLPIGECYWVQLPNPLDKNLVISRDSNSNWNDDLIQFSRFICELEMAGKLGDIGELRDVLESMDLAPESLCELVDRAQKVWDCVISRTTGGARAEKADSPRGSAKA